MNEQADFDVERAEQTLRLHSWYYCGWCEDAPGNVCDAHRCRATTAAGSQCRKAVSDENPMYCKQHQCSMSWVLDGETITCTSLATVWELPDGRRIRICDQHHQMVQAA